MSNPIWYDSNRGVTVEAVPVNELAELTEKAAMLDLLLSTTGVPLEALRAAIAAGKGAAT